MSCAMKLQAHYPYPDPVTIEMIEKNIAEIAWKSGG